MTQPPYGQYPWYGQGAPYGQPPPPPPSPENKLLPWLIVGGAVLLSAMGILLVLLLRSDDRGSTSAAAPSTSPASSAPATSASASAHGELPGGARVADQDTAAGQARFDRSDEVALGWLQAMADGDFQTAYDLSCADVQQSATDAAAGADPAWTLGTYFFEQTLSRHGFTDGSFDSIIYSQESGSDIASFTLQLDDGEDFLLLVYVQSDGTVCDFI
ncbi:MAG: hypothetical protein ACJ71Y_08000 [Blastococcus sp.]